MAPPPGPTPRSSAAPLIVIYEKHWWSSSTNAGSSRASHQWGERRGGEAGHRLPPAGPAASGPTARNAVCYDGDMGDWRHVLLFLAFVGSVVAPVAQAAGDRGGEPGAQRTTDAWVLVLEPTEAYANVEDGRWILTDEVRWTGHVGEWYEVLIAVLDIDQGDWVLAVREDDPDELFVWLALDDRVALLIDEAAPLFCDGSLSRPRCLGAPLSSVLGLVDPTD